MTTELKTLKDYEHNIPLGIDKDGNFIFVVKIEDLKAEAIKWIKDELRKIDEGDDETSLMGGFMQFFNLSEEDLAE